MSKNKKAELIQLQKEFDEFAYIVSHDLKAPLRAIANITEWIEEDFGPDIDEDIKDNFHLLKGRVKKLTDMIDALNVYSRINRRDLDVLEINLTKTIADIKDEIEFKYSNVKIHKDVEVNVLETYSKKLYQVIEELIENAAKHNSEKELLNVFVKIRKQDEWLMIEVSDDGVGIPANLHEEIFNLFYTLEPKDRSKNLGAGLNKIKKIIDFVSGEITVNEIENRLIFEVKWPFKIK